MPGYVGGDATGTRDDYKIRFGLGVGGQTFATDGMVAGKDYKLYQPVFADEALQSIKIPHKDVFLKWTLSIY